MSICDLTKLDTLALIFFPEEGHPKMAHPHPLPFKLNHLMKKFIFKRRGIYIPGRFTISRYG